MRYKIGIDVGGTFTDFLLTHSDGQSLTYKVLSIPKDPSIATMQGIADIARDDNLSLKDFLVAVDVIVHGTTVTTSAGEDRSRAYKRNRQVYVPNQAEFGDAPVFEGLALQFGNRIEGPAIIEQVKTTTFVEPEFNVLTDRFGSFTMYLKAGEDEVKRGLLS